MTKLLITGAGGMLGANLVLDELAAGQRVIAVDYQHPVRHPRVESVTADLSRPGAAQAILADRRPAWVIHCAAATDVDACEADPEMAFRLNRDMAGQVAMAAHAVGARLAHISTDAVFDGEQGGYTEEDEPHPINVYGESKAEGERVVLSEHPEALIVRTNIYGWNAQAKQSLAEWFLARLEAGQPCPGFTDAWFSPILVNDLGIILVRLLASGQEGIWHVAGGECVTKYEFGVQIAAVFDLDARLIMPSTARDHRLMAKRGRQLCLQSNRIDGLSGVEPPTIGQGLRHWKQLRMNGFTDRLRGLLVTHRLTEAAHV